jgi:hypothetical protein
MQLKSKPDDKDTTEYSPSIASVQRMQKNSSLHHVQIISTGNLPLQRLPTATVRHYISLAIKRRKMQRERRTNCDVKPTLMLKGF